MTLQRFISRQPLLDSEARSLAPAVADRLAESIVGRARLLWELATGANPVDDEGGSRLNPQGKRGVDRSGGPWGDAIEHPLWGYESDASLSAVVYGRVFPWISLTSQGQIARRAVTLEVRPFETRDRTPYSRGIVTLRALRIGGAGTATATIRCYADAALVASTTGALSCTSSTVLTTSTSAPWIGLRPGVQTVLIEVELTSTVGMEIHQASISQVARRSH